MVNKMNELLIYWYNYLTLNDLKHPTKPHTIRSANPQQTSFDSKQIARSYGYIPTTLDNLSVMPWLPDDRMRHGAAPTTRKSHMVARTRRLRMNAGCMIAAVTSNSIINTESSPWRPAEHQSET